MAEGGGMEAAPVPADEPAEGISPGAAPGENPLRGAEQDLVRAEFLVGGMGSITPVRAIGDLLESQEGVHRAQVDAAVERVTVDYDARLTLPGRARVHHGGNRVRGGRPSV